MTASYSKQEVLKVGQFSLNINNNNNKSSSPPHQSLISSLPSENKINWVLSESTTSTSSNKQSWQWSAPKLGSSSRHLVLWPSKTISSHWPFFLHQKAALDCLIRQQAGILSQAHLMSFNHIFPLEKVIPNNWSDFFFLLTVLFQTRYFFKNALNLFWMYFYF